MRPPAVILVTMDGWNFGGTTESRCQPPLGAVAGLLFERWQKISENTVPVWYGSLGNACGAVPGSFPDGLPWAKAV
jgi:hypothetical protein